MALVKAAVAKEDEELSQLDGEEHRGTGGWETEVSLLNCHTKAMHWYRMFTLQLVQVGLKCANFHF